MNFYIYGSEYCGFTKKTKQLFNKYNIEFNDNIVSDNNFKQININGKNIMKQFNIYNMSDLINYNQIPLIFFVNNNDCIFIGGYTDINKIINYVIELKKNKSYNEINNSLSEFKNKLLSEMTLVLINNKNII
jgi:glutaredoxin